MNLNQLNRDTLDTLDSAYVIAQSMCRTDPLTASPGKQRRVCKWLRKDYLRHEEIPEAAAACLAPDRTDREVLEYLHACCRRMQELDQQDRRQTEETLARLPADVTQLLHQLILDDCLAHPIPGTDGTLRLSASFSSGQLTQVLVLTDVQGLPAELPAGPLYLNEHVLPAENGRIALTFSPEYGEINDGSPLSFTVTFADARVEYAVCRIQPVAAYASPWMSLAAAALSVITKYQEFPPEFLNEQERQLLPLLAELVALFPSDIPAELRHPGFPQLTELARTHGDKALVRILKTGESADHDPRFASWLLRQLNHARYEGLWRKIAAMLAESQAGYPDAYDAFPVTASAEACRAQITATLLTAGYTGTYPDFEKRAPLQRSGWLRSSDVAAHPRPHLLLRGRPGIYRIHCREDRSCGTIAIIFECTAQFPKKGQPELDAIGCRFDRSGTCFAHGLFSSAYDNSPAEFRECLSKDLLRVLIDIEHRRPTPSQRALLGLPSLWERVTLFLTSALVMGVLFGILFIPFMLLITVLVTLLEAGPAAVGPILADIPWGSVFLLGGGAFGVIMGAVFALS